MISIYVSLNLSGYSVASIPIDGKYNEVCYSAK